MERVYGKTFNLVSALSEKTGARELLKERKFGNIVVKYYYSNRDIHLSRNFLIPKGEYYIQLHLNFKENREKGIPVKVPDLIRDIVSLKSHSEGFPMPYAVYGIANQHIASVAKSVGFNIEKSSSSFIYKSAVRYDYKERRPGRNPGDVLVCYLSRNDFVNKFRT